MGSVSLGLTELAVIEHEAHILVNLTFDKAQDITESGIVTAVRGTIWCVTSVSNMETGRCVLALRSVVRPLAATFSAFSDLLSAADSHISDISARQQTSIRKHGSSKHRISTFNTSIASESNCFDATKEALHHPT